MVFQMWLLSLLTLVYTLTLTEAETVSILYPRLAIQVTR